MKHQLMIDVKQKGQARYAPCCNFKKSLDINKFTEQVTHYNSLLEEGIRIPECSICWETEDLGLGSVRTGYGTDWDKTLEPAIFSMDIRIHNKCNLACTMCYSGASNLWGKLENQDTYYKISDSELSVLKKKVKNVTRISFQGGEPFYGTEYDDFLMSIDNLENITVDVFTNAITTKREVIQRWRDKLKRLELNVSVDGYDEIYNSIRWPATWSKFESKAKMLYDILGENMSYFWTVQAENAVNLFDFIEWRNKNTPLCNINVVNIVGCSELGVLSMSEHEKSEFFKRYSEYKNTSEKQIKEYKQISAIYRIILNSKTDTELLNTRTERLETIYDMRERYTEK
jgi:hypothetical protein